MTVVSGIAKTIRPPDINAYLSLKLFLIKYNWTNHTVGVQIGTKEKTIAHSQVKSNITAVRILTDVVFCLYLIGYRTAKYRSYIG